MRVTQKSSHEVRTGNWSGVVKARTLVNRRGSRLGLVGKQELTFGFAPVMAIDFMADFGRTTVPSSSLERTQKSVVETASLMVLRGNG